MEQSTNETFDESLNEPSSSAASSKDVCRLRHGLNVNCLLRVFDKLEVDDLIKLCDMDPHFKEVITKWTIKKKMIKFPKLYPTKTKNQDEELQFRKADHPLLIKTFETFGKSMRKFTTKFATFSLLLQLIIEYCEADTLTEIALHISGVSLPADQKLLDRSIPFFSNLRKFKLITYKSPSADEQKKLSNFLTKILSSAANLHEIVTDVDITGGWLKSANNLHELRIDSRWKHKFSIDDLATCFKMNANLKVFKISYWDNDIISPIGDALSQSCPNLEYFGERHISSPYRRIDSIINRYNFLSTLPHLNRVTLTSYTRCCSDLYYHLKNLAKSNIVKLEIFVGLGALTLDKNETSDLMTRWLPDFTNIRTIEITSYTLGAGFEFIFHLAKYLKNLKTLMFDASPMTGIHKILELAPSIETLDLSAWKHRTDDNCIRAYKNIVETLRKIRQFNGDHQHLLNLKVEDVDNKCLQELFADAKDIMIVSIIQSE